MRSQPGRQIEPWYIIGRDRFVVWITVSPEVRKFQLNIKIETFLQLFFFDIIISDLICKKKGNPILG
jgi:hypothetical protein